MERKVRIEAAKAALPYEFGKVGEMGIKDGREAAAGVVAKKSKFATADEQRKKQIVS
jgi:phage terminase small subunit